MIKITIIEQRTGDTDTITGETLQECCQLLKEMNQMDPPEYWRVTGITDTQTGEAIEI